ncbi:nucleoside phosphorylase [Actinokineospora baliensis]|uniref:5'-methylthioadenosine/S-adenosylhomocysteine nucleosidase family protein n=1 Tax=Actinokineospora baliensis TaxID=547056 RepID=UPI00195910FE|nr:5'-methylthioadenosine/S-adenosylhomocysteine nucleosidase [Actinokineospora baliensis]MBM7774694.1 nucleoside phosphorylase [Actinokineospora baliensis]
MADDLVVVLTAINVEYEQVRQRLVAPSVRTHPSGTRFEVGTLTDTGCRVALGLTGKGNHAAGILAERAVSMFSPVAVMFVGVAGALWDNTALGDVVVATHVYAYHGGTSEDDGLKARPRVWEAAHGVLQVAAHLGRSGDWNGQTPAPKVHFGAIAAGEVVQNSRTSAEARWLRQHYNDAIAVEMEAAGVAQAGHLSGAPVVIVRGISDLADGTKRSAEDVVSQPNAAKNAAAFAVRLAVELVKGRQHSARSEENAVMGTVNNSNASGIVGIQAGTVTGSTVWLTAAPRTLTTVDLAAELDVLRDLVTRARAQDRMDVETHRAASLELDTASDALAAEGTSTFVLALKRLRGLVADVAEIAAKVVALIAAAKELM